MLKIRDNAPVTEPERQYYFIDVCKTHIEKLKEELGHQPTCCVITFGCQMNARDSEKLAGILEQVGYLLVEEEDKADFVIYNTCTVRDNANQRVYGRLGALKNKKKKNPKMKIALCGCMMQEDAVIEKMKKSYRYVDLIFGTHNIYKFAELLTASFEEEGMIIDIWKDTDIWIRMITTEMGTAVPFAAGRRKTPARWFICPETSVCVRTACRR